MSRRRRAADSSLELLLDTICNTFGGVLFLAILVAVLLRTTSKVATPDQPPDSPPPPTAAELAELSRQRTETQAELESLQQAAAEQGKLAEQFTDEENVPLLEERRRLQAELNHLAATRVETLEDIAQAQAAAARIVEELKELDSQLATAEQASIEAQANLEAERQARTQSARLPRLRSTTKREIGLIVRFNRLYVWHRYNQFGLREGLNTDEFVIIGEKDGYFETAPKPYRGISLAAANADVTVSHRLAAFDSGSCHLTLSVWDDSFGTFQALKNILISLGFEYRLMPIAEGGGVVDRGGIGGRVQ